MYDAVVVGSGPNGLATAVELARNGHSVIVLEAEDTIGGGTRSAELTLPGYVHDVCSAIHPFGYASPFFSALPLEEHDLEWVHPPAPLAHPFDDGSAAVLKRSVEETGDTLGPDNEAYRKLMKPIARDFDRLLRALLGQLRLPRHPIALARFGLRAVRSARCLAENLFEGEKARGLFAGNAAHSALPMERVPSGAFGLVFYPRARGGLAIPERRLAEDSRRAGLLSALFGRRDLHRRPGWLRGGGAPDPRGPLRLDAATTSPHRRRALPRALLASARALPVRPRRL